MRGLRLLRALLGVGLVAGALAPAGFADSVVAKKGADGKITYTNTDRRPKKGSASGRDAASPGQAESAGPRISDELIQSKCTTHGLDPQLVKCLIRQESGFRQNVMSRKGACGVMQLMPATARRFGVNDVWDVEQNLEGGMRYLRFLLDTFDNNIPLALAGYNAGENAVTKYGNRIPPYKETTHYVTTILSAYGDAALLEQARGLMAAPGSAVREPSAAAAGPARSGPVHIWRYRDDKGSWVFANSKPKGKDAEKVMVID